MAAKYLSHKKLIHKISPQKPANITIFPYRFLSSSVRCGSNSAAGKTDIKKPKLYIPCSKSPRGFLNNLLGNAWKYTSTRDEGIIEFGETEVDGNPALFVRDNGVSFDMAHAGKLFQAFQRLPGTEQFRGTGIGLATVEGIIKRQGRRIWAVGEPGKGATFYFTLQE